MSRKNGQEGGFVKNNNRRGKGDKKEKKEKDRRFPAKAGKNKPARPAGEGAKFFPVAPKQVVPAAEIVYEHGIAAMFALDTTFSGQKYYVIDGAKFCAQVAGFKNAETGDWVKYVEVTLQEVPAAPHNLSHLPESACQISLARGCIYKTKEAVSKPRGMDDQTYERKLVIWEFLHEVWKQAGEPRANNGGNPFTVIRHRLQREVPAILKSKPAPQQSVLAEALAPMKEVLERAKYSSSASGFIRGEEGEYAFPKNGPAVSIRMTARREIVLLGVEEGNPLFDILDGHANESRFTIDHLTGKTPLQKSIREGEDGRSVATRVLCEKLREFLRPFGLKEEVQRVAKAAKPSEPVRDPSREITLEQFRAGDVGRLSFEGVSLRAVDGRGNTGKPRVEVSVVAVDGQHPDHNFLQGLVGKRLFISTYLVKMDFYPRDGLKGKSEEELDSLEALFLLLRRAFGHQAEFMRDKKLSNNSKAAAEEAVEAIVLPPTTTEDVPVGATVH
jgi:hypothetical protein